MDPSLAGLLGAYGSGDEEEEDNVQILSPGAVAAQGLSLLSPCTTVCDMKRISST